MALSGSFSGSYRGYTLKTEWSAMQNVEKNYSDLEITLYLICDSGYNLYIGQRTHTLNIAGTDYSITSSSISTDGGSTIKLGSISKRIYHNTDGTLDVWLSSTCDMRANIRGTYVGTFSGGSDTITVDKIPRMSTISDTMDGTRELGTSHTIYLNVNLSNVTHTVWYRIRGDKGVSKWFTIAEKSSNKNFTFTPTDAHVDLQPNSSRIYMDLSVRTFKSGEQLGEDVYSDGWYMQVPSKAVPTISNIQISEANEKMGEIGVYVQNHSKFHFFISRSGYKGSNIKETKILVDGQTVYGYNSTSKEIKSSGDLKVTVIVKDTRDRITTSTKTVRVEPYTIPSILDFNGYRLDTDEKIVTIKRNFRMSSLAGKNTTKWKTERRPIGSSTWTTISSGTNNSLNSNELTYNVSADYEYEMRLTISDFAYTQTKSFYVYTSFSLLDFHNSGTGIAIGKSATRKNIFEVDLPTVFKRTVYIERQQLPANWEKCKLYNTTQPYNSGNELKYVKDAMGFVHLQGNIKGTGSTGYIGQIINAKCRPNKDIWISVPCSDYKQAILKIEKGSGDILIWNREEIITDWVSLDGISFFVD